MGEYVIAASIRGDKTVPLGVAEPFNGTRSHAFLASRTYSFAIKLKWVKNHIINMVKEGVCTSGIELIIVIPIYYSKFFIICMVLGKKAFILLKMPPHIPLRGFGKGN